MRPILNPRGRSLSVRASACFLLETDTMNGDSSRKAIEQRRRDDISGVAPALSVAEQRTRGFFAQYSPQTTTGEMCATEDPLFKLQIMNLKMITAAINNSPETKSISSTQNRMGC